MSEERQAFQAEVGRILDLMVHSVYSDKEIFLRELISNAADACDRLRYRALAEPELLGGEGVFGIRIEVDKAARTIAIIDNGEGMGREELVGNLGTIARSGTAAFADSLTGDAKRDVALIGQFGVGFYSAFMVAERVRVVSRAAGAEVAFVWESDGRGEFTVSEAEREARGTEVRLYLREGEDEFLEPARLRAVVKTYSDHIAIPVEMAGETVNEASALWTRPRSDIEPEQYTEFYRHVGHTFDEPWLTLHFRAEGVIEYTGLLFVPTSRPFDLFHPDRKAALKLYVKRVFITDEAPELVPAWLRFLRGVVDSEDLPLNLSREMLQRNPVLRRIRDGLVRRVLGELKTKAEEDKEGYETFWDAFGPVLKEGLYEESGQREALLELARFRSTASDGWTTLAGYVERMRDGQEAIYYIAGEEGAALAGSPHLEGFRARKLEVLLLQDPVDDFWVSAVGDYDGKRFVSVSRGGIDLGAIAPVDETPVDEAGQEADIAALVALFKVTLGEAVKDVRGSEALTESAVRLVADEGDMDLHLERMLRRHGQIDGAASRRVLELNPRHRLVQGLARSIAAGEDRAAALAPLLLDQARIAEGEAPDDPAAFARLLADALADSLPAG
ncbi:MAG: molecular chaperone HtpG [Alphaproteobacteria bacterium]|nr:molecular chaperone HtpG [Alphaproteobacteria bacterium]